MITPFLSLACTQTQAEKFSIIVKLLSKFSDTFSEIYVLHQNEEPIYDLLKQTIKKVTVVSKSSDLPSHEDLAKSTDSQKLFIFDDDNNEEMERLADALDVGATRDVLEISRLKL